MAKMLPARLSALLLVLGLLAGGAMLLTQAPPATAASAGCTRYLGDPHGDSETGVVRCGSGSDYCYQCEYADGLNCAEEPDPANGAICSYLPFPEDGGASVPNPQGQQGPTGSPIVLDLDGGGFRFTGLHDTVRFDIDADGRRDLLTWTARDSDDALLALDRDGNGAIDSGAELFGNFTAQPPAAAPNGFLALAVYDREELGGDADGWISAADAVYADLRLWIDADHDGLSQTAELLPLPERGVLGIGLAYVESRRRDRHGNQLHWASRVRFEHGQPLAAVDVSFLLR